MSSTSNIDCKHFVWDKEEKVDILANFKSQMEFTNRDLNADKVKIYEEVRKSIARIYVEKPSFFWPIAPRPREASPEEAKIDNLYDCKNTAMQ